MNKISINIFFILLTTYSSAQRINISGYIIDSLSNEKLIAATVWAKNRKLGTISNDYGFFSLTLNSSQAVELQISYVGYKSRTLIFSKDTVLSIALKSDNNLDEVEVVANAYQRIEKRNEISTVELPMKDLNLLPALGGERDILKAYQLFPGVQRGTEGSSDLYVRGGSPDQNLILLDGVPLYNVKHLGGFVGIFNSDAIKSSKLIKGGFPAEYGSRLSSVLDIRMKDGNNQKRNNNYTIGLLSSKVMFEGPFKKGKSSYMVSGRRFMYDLLWMPMLRLTTKNWYSYSFYDLNVKINQEINRNNHLYLSFYSGDDAFILTIKESDKTGKVKFRNRWGNSLAAMRWNHLFNSRLFGNTTLSYTQYHSLYFIDAFSLLNSQKTHNRIDNQTTIKDFSLKNDFTFYTSPIWTIKYGTNAIIHSNIPANFSQISETNRTVYYQLKSPDTQFLSYETAAYVENKFNFENGLSGNIGLRFSDYYVEKHNFYSFEPRFLIAYLISENYKISLSYSKMQQYIHLITGNGTGIHADFWMPATNRIPPLQSQQFVVSFSSTLFKNIEFSVEGFYKKMQNLITFKEGISYYGINTNWQDKVETAGIGNVYGAEFLLQKKIGNNTGWIAYTWSKNNRKFSNVNQGKTYPFRYDRRHNISLVYNLKINKKINFSATWVYNTGEALSLPETQYKAPDIYLANMVASNKGSEYVYSAVSKNAVRAKAYHRLDIGINFRKQKKKGIRTWNISIYNVYNRKNAFYYAPGESISNNNGTITGRAGFRAQTMFPILPSVSYSYKF